MACCQRQLALSTNVYALHTTSTHLSNMLLLRSAQMRVTGITAATLVAVALAALLLITGCGGNSRSQSRTLPPLLHGWRAVIADWRTNGQLADRHSCADVRAAFAHLPESFPSHTTVAADFRAYARKVCP